MIYFIIKEFNQLILKLNELKGALGNINTQRLQQTHTKYGHYDGN